MVITDVSNVVESVDVKSFGSLIVCFHLLKSTRSVEVFAG